MAVKPAPTLDLEDQVLGAGAIRVAGMDEVGRGALAGPVTVGVAVIDASVSAVPGTLRDSKLLRPAVREALVPQVQNWAVATGTGTASPAEIDALGIVGALRLAGQRALGSLAPSARPDVVLLDGVHDWLSEPTAALFSAADGEPGIVPVEAPGAQGARVPGGRRGTVMAADGADRGPRVAEPEASSASAWLQQIPVRTVVKGDLSCASIAAASVVAKVERDAVMVALHDGFPEYGWASNKGYGSLTHKAALQEHGVCEVHRRSWNLGLSG